MVYFLAFIIASCLVGGQSLWASTVKKLTSQGLGTNGIILIKNMLFQPKFWLGVTCYLIGTGCYFLLLSRAKFFSVQITMTGLAIVLSVLVAKFLFHEQVSLLNLVGVFLVLSGTVLIFNK
ncbi:MAG: hypothetical protein NTV95_01515 [Candidatus Saccharibacteria bacterium]|nr:hypothetical protein [Candidatus Saccharibacteria bacterium]